MKALAVVVVQALGGCAILLGSVWLLGTGLHWLMPSCF